MHPLCRILTGSLGMVTSRLDSRLLFPGSILSDAGPF